jgi:uracil-DNA glycosylase
MPYTPTLPFAHSSGPRDAKIAIVGEAWSEQEELLKKPFIGYAGQELTKLLREAEIPRSRCFLTNVFALRPKDNLIESLCVGKAEAGLCGDLPDLGKKGKYLHPQYIPEVLRLKAELDAVKPNLIIAMGGTATWALLNSTKITSIRGAIADSLLCPGIKVLPTYHPAAVLRNWAWRPIVLADLLKAEREAKFPEIIRRKRYVTVLPTIEEILEWIETHKPLSDQCVLSVDIETKMRQIEMIGFATSFDYVLTVPFIDASKAGNSYWPTLDMERRAWRLVKDILEGPATKLFQNGLFDLQYILRAGINPRNCLHDTMLLHHSLYPEMQKGLGFLGSIYSNEASWKLLRVRNDELKKDE